MHHVATEIERRYLDNKSDDRTPLYQRDKYQRCGSRNKSRNANNTRTPVETASRTYPAIYEDQNRGQLQRKPSLFERIFVMDPETNQKPRSVFTIVVRPLLAECYGLLIFVFMGTMAISTHKGLLVAALAHGLTIFFLVASLGHISGGHFNPAVTLGLALSGGIKPVLAFFYIVAQLVGSLIGSSFAMLALPYMTFTKINGGANTLTTTDGVSFTMGLICECLTTMALVTTVLNSAFDTDGKNPLAPLAIGITVGVDILATGHISGASMNPARSFGPAVLANIWQDHILNWIGPFSGAMVASFMYRFVFAANDRNLTTSWYMYKLEYRENT